MSANHIVFCINNNWTMQCGILIQSILYFNRSPFVFHIISKNISEENKTKLKNVLLNTESKIEFHQISNEYDSKFILREGDHVSVETYYRFFIPDLLPENVDKALYLDADILCLNNFDKLFETDLSDFACGMVEDCRAFEIGKFNRLEYDIQYGYCNAGVMLINLSYWRKNNLRDKLIDFVIKNPEKCWAHDQDAINALLHKNIKRISFKYNLQTILLKYFMWKDLRSCPKEVYIDSKIKKADWPLLEESLYDPCFIHFTDEFKPWIKKCNTPFTKIWLQFYKHSQWKNIKLQRTIKPKKAHIKLALKKSLSKIHLFNYNLDRFPEETYSIENKLLSQINL